MLLGASRSGAPIYAVSVPPPPPEHLTLVTQFLFSHLPRPAAEGWSQPSLALALVDETFVGLQGSLVLF